MSSDLAWQTQNSQRAKVGLHCYYTWEWRGEAFNTRCRDMPVATCQLFVKEFSCLGVDSSAGGLQCSTRFVQVNIFLLRMIPLRGVIAEKGRNHDPIVAVWGQCCLLSKFDLWYVCWHCYICLYTDHWLHRIVCLHSDIWTLDSWTVKMRFSYINSLFGSFGIVVGLANSVCWFWLVKSDNLQHTDFANITQE